MLQFDNFQEISDTSVDRNFDAVYRLLVIYGSIEHKYARVWITIVVLANFISIFIYTCLKTWIAYTPKFSFIPLNPLL